MGRHHSSCCPKQKLRKGLWSPEEDEKLFNYITRFGVGCWSSVPKLAGLQRCGKSCRLRWINYLRPDLKRGTFSREEEHLIISLHRDLGNRWAQISAHLPGRTDNEIKNFWNSSLKKKLMKQGIDPTTHLPLRPPSTVEDKASNSDFSAQKPQLISGFLPTIAPVKTEETVFNLEINNGQIQQFCGYLTNKQIFDVNYPSQFEPGFGYNPSILAIPYPDHQHTLKPNERTHLDPPPIVAESATTGGYPHQEEIAILLYQNGGSNYLPENEFSENSMPTTTSSCLLSSSTDGKERSSSSSNMNTADIDSSSGLPSFSSWVDNNNSNNAGYLGTKMESLFQREEDLSNWLIKNSVKEEEEGCSKQSPWQVVECNEDDQLMISSFQMKLLSDQDDYYMATANLDVFGHQQARDSLSCYNPLSGPKT